MGSEGPEIWEGAVSRKWGTDSGRGTRRKPGEGVSGAGVAALAGSRVGCGRPLAISGDPLDY